MIVRRALLIVTLGAALSAAASAEEPPISFVNDVQPVLTKAGCNQGTCHGAQYGQGGFKLSLRAFDDPADHDELVKRAHGRRIRFAAPKTSLLLTKPTMEVAHKGGRRLEPGTYAYDTLLHWIEEGARGPQPNERKLKSLTVTPGEASLAAGQTVQVEARAIYDDGFEESVNRKASFDSTRPNLIKVSAEGLATALAPGEAAVMVRYLGHVAVSRVMIPYAAPADLASFTRVNYIDELWVKKWQALGLSPAELCSDEEFFRRIHLHTIATPPKPEDIRAFLADPDPTKRDRAIDAVLNRPEYVDYWAYKWGDLLLSNRRHLQKKGMWSLHNWLRASFRDNKPLDKFATELITATGSPYAYGPANFFVLGYADEWTESASQVFLGMRVQCAKCHHHPYENISQADYTGMKAFFARVGKKGSLDFGLQGSDFTIYVNEGGEVGHPRTGQIIKPQPPGGEQFEDPVDRRRALAGWLTKKDNLVYARNLANRYWNYYTGRGLVDPVDDIRTTNPASNPELLDALARDLVEHNYDIKHLLRTIMRSRTYQLSSRTIPASAVDVDNRYYTRFTPRRLTAEQLLDAIDLACGTQEKFAEVPLGYRAISLPDSEFPSEFLDVFGRPSRKVTCECERSDMPNMTQALLMVSGSLLHRKVTDGNGRIAKWVAENLPPEKAVEEIFLLTVARPPSSDELHDAVVEVTAAPTPKEGLEDLLWTMLNTREFQFNH